MKFFIIVFILLVLYKIFFDKEQFLVYEGFESKKNYSIENCKDNQCDIKCHTELKEPLLKQKDGKFISTSVGLVKYSTDISNYLCKYYLDKSTVFKELVKFRKKDPSNIVLAIIQKAQKTYTIAEFDVNGTLLNIVRDSVNYNKYVAPPKPIVVPPKPIVAPPKPIVVPPKPIVAPPKPIVAPPKPIVVPPKPIVVPPKPIVVQEYEPEPATVEEETEAQPAPYQEESTSTINNKNINVNVSGKRIIFEKVGERGSSNRIEVTFHPDGTYVYNSDDLNLDGTYEVNGMMVVVDENIKLKFNKVEVEVGNNFVDEDKGISFVIVEVSPIRNHMPSWSEEEDWNTEEEYNYIMEDPGGKVLDNIVDVGSEFAKEFGIKLSNSDKELIKNKITGQATNIVNKLLDKDDKEVYPKDIIRKQINKNKKLWLNKQTDCVIKINSGNKLFINKFAIVYNTYIENEFKKRLGKIPNSIKIKDESKMTFSELTMYNDILKKLPDCEELMATYPIEDTSDIKPIKDNVISNSQGVTITSIATADPPSITTVVHKGPNSIDNLVKTLSQNAPNNTHTSNGTANSTGGTTNTAGGTVNSTGGTVNNNKQVSKNRQILKKKQNLNFFKQSQESPKYNKQDGNTYISPKFWSVPQKRAPVCNPGKNGLKDVPGYNGNGFPINSLELTEVGSLMPKFKYEEKG